MKLNIYSFFDSGVKAFTTPFFLQNDGAAVRAFQDNVNAKEQNNISLHPDQFTLYKVGQWDDENAEISKYEPAVSLGNGLTFKDETTEEISNREITKKIDAIMQRLDNNWSN